MTAPMETPDEARAIIMRVAAEAETILNTISPAGTLCVAGGVYDHYRYGTDGRSQFALLRGDVHGSMWETVLRIATRRVQREMGRDNPVTTSAGELYPCDRCDKTPAYRVSASILCEGCSGGRS